MLLELRTECLRSSHCRRRGYQLAGCVLKDGWDRRAGSRQGICSQDWVEVCEWVSVYGEWAGTGRKSEQRRHSRIRGEWGSEGVAKWASPSAPCLRVTLLPPGWLLSPTLRITLLPPGWLLLREKYAKLKIESTFLYCQSVKKLPLYAKKRFFYTHIFFCGKNRDAMYMYSTCTVHVHLLWLPLITLVFSITEYCTITRL